MRARVLLLVAAPLSLLSAGGGVRAAQAEPLEQAPTSLAGFELLARVGYGASTAQVRDLELEPYGACLGLDFGYRWHSGFRLGAAVDYGFGHAIPQHRDGRDGREYDLIADTSSLTGALSVGYDVPVSFLTLRYSLDLGAMAMKWDIGNAPVEAFFEEADWHSPTWSFFLAPGASLLWPRGSFEMGVGFEYLVPTHGAIPTGFVGRLIGGVKW